ncbi:hypothetical protein Mal64_31060 [Pseudobythopirellula maris]|uniref:Nickel uptake substrate-specific transmembrane region n=1 Tax=Pseudobythopirellula maris TaxID=2527991 RepID=A0A5C5ZJK4_9BACT|nr:carboxypeptidase-like regulatory domain-containing protein [Pseudobythopirellula maris]TWT87564.1 hypothetical protein Mal64_31060 [Pseudobythopirellula maris]
MKSAKTIAAVLLIAGLAPAAQGQEPPTAPRPLSASVESSAADAMSAKPAKPAHVAMTSDGLFRGRLVAAEGKPIGGAEVRLTAANGETALARTNRNGQFAFRGAKGVCVVESSYASRTCHVWTADAAPPSVEKQLALVEAPLVVRGQHAAPFHANPMVRKSKQMMAKPGVAATVLGLGIAAPVIIHNVNQDDDPSS